MSFASSIILLIQGQANITAIRYFSASLLDLGEFPRKREALQRLLTFREFFEKILFKWGLNCKKVVVRETFRWKRAECFKAG
jgi:hypothetical protein